MSIWDCKMLNACIASGGKQHQAATHWLPECVSLCLSIPGCKKVFSHMDTNIILHSAHPGSVCLAV